MMRNHMKALVLAIAGGMLLLQAPAAISSQFNDDSDNVGATYTKKGADSCIKCHDEDNEYPVFPIFKTKHAQPADPRTPFGKRQCESCHGPGGEHSKKIKSGEERPPILSFGHKSVTPPTERNRPCLSCHEDHGRINWKGSIHETNDLACASCHVIHTAKDEVMTRFGQQEVCFRCHKKERSDIFRTSTHPLRYGKINCSDCHDSHGAPGPHLLIRPSTNETCFTCHAEKRGPFLWQHAPVDEDCTLCHRSHGSSHPALLKKRSFLLCRECHSSMGHPSIAPGSSTPTALSFDRFLLAKGCMNCHPQVHGSNHPSGVKLNR